MKTDSRMLAREEIWGFIFNGDSFSSNIGRVQEKDLCVHCA